MPSRLIMPNHITYMADFKTTEFGWGQWYGRRRLLAPIGQLSLWDDHGGAMACRCRSIPGTTTSFIPVSIWNYYRLNRKTNENNYIQPKHELGESPYRFNWQTPILLSSHNQDILYFGGNKLMRSLNRGDDWKPSPRFDQWRQVGNVVYGTLTTITESPFQFWLLYRRWWRLVYVSQNSGADWTNISQSFPKDLWVSRVVASQHKKVEGLCNIKWLPLGQF